MIGTQLTAVAMTLCLSLGQAGGEASEAKSEGTDPTVASPLIQQLLQNLVKSPANGNSTSNSPARGPRFKLSGLILTSPTSGAAVIKAQSGTIRLTLKKSIESDTVRSADRFGAKAAGSPGETSPGESRTGTTEVDLSSSFSDGDSLFRVVDFRRGMILLEEIPAGRLIIVR